MNAPAPAARPPGFLADWVGRKGLYRGSIESLIEGFCRRAIEGGIPLDRMNYIVQVLHPLSRVAIYRRRSDEDKVWTLSPPRDRTSEARFDGSPFKVVFETRAPLRRRLEGAHVVRDFPILNDLAEEGFTDYLVVPLPFSDGVVNAAAFATWRKGGFSESDCEALQRAARALAAPLEALQGRRLSGAIADPYLGRRTGTRVLRGAITRGSGESIRAVIWYCDLRDFTPLSERSGADDLIAVLNDYFEAVGVPIQTRGGEILKFIGDAILAIWPLDGDAAAAQACATALDAWREARANMAALNQRRAAAGEPALDFGVTLHVGEVIYGNIGAPDRLDFTVIGPAVNLVTRMEDLTKTLARPLLVSQAFADASAATFEPLGAYPFKGIAEPQPVYAPPEPRGVSRASRRAGEP